MKIGFYPGSFNPIHEGHEDILCKALKVFDKIVILQLTNSEKSAPAPIPPETLAHLDAKDRIEILRRENSFLTTVIGNYILGIQDISEHQYAIIRGLRNGNDLEYEKAQMYWNEDLGLKMPTVYFVADRALVHISSSAIRIVNKFMELENERNSDNSK